MAHILILNPCGSAPETDRIDASLAPLRAATTRELICGYIEGAPMEIENDDDLALVAPMVESYARTSSADALVVASFLDPGLAAARATRRLPVIGIAEAAFCAALQLGWRFGIISPNDASVARHSAHLDEMRLRGRLAGDRAIDPGVDALNDPRALANAVRDVGRTLHDEDGADVLILGSAGMGAQRAPLQAALELPVIEPVQAGAAAAIAQLELGYFPKAGG